jgi:hypothetical protein
MPRPTRVGLGAGRNEINQSRGLFVLMMEAASTSETSVNFYHTTWRNFLKDSHLHTRRRENLKSHLLAFVNHIFSSFIKRIILFSYITVLNPGR